MPPKQVLGKIRSSSVSSVRAAVVDWEKITTTITDILIIKKNKQYLSNSETQNTYRSNALISHFKYQNTSSWEHTGSESRKYVKRKEIQPQTTKDE